MTGHHAIDFDNALRQGKASYTGAVGDWWLKQGLDRAHQRAYSLIADRLRRAFETRRARLIVEYACGPGLLLARLARRFPEARIVGIDGSRQMLEMARRRLARLGGEDSGRIELIESRLPCFDLPCREADAVVFAFPNICPAPGEQAYYDKHGSRHPADRAVARLLAKAREEDPELETVFEDPKTLAPAMLDAKVVARNLRGLLRKGGLCLRAEYANAPRSEMTDLVNLRLDFEGGAMEGAFRGRRPEAIFRRVDGTYHRSRVILDVYHQTADEDILRGGYLLNLLKAI
jgi:SAM-dependent methyltransferase